jgi:hypothetical protein
MTLQQRIQLTQDVSNQHFFFFSEALGAFQDMIALTFDLSPGSTERFNQAKARLELTRKRCNDEMKRLPQ